MATHTQVTPLMKTDITADSLAKKPRFNETVIQGFLFICGILSIFTTIGIVYILLSESMAFFSSEQWENTNKTLAAELSAASTTMSVSSSGAILQPDNLIR